jgi:guanylate kinase
MSNIYVIIGPSGVGKDTIANKILKSTELVYSISTTTRKPRSSEIPDIDYHFVDTDTFNDMIQKDEFIEYANIHNNYYGTTYDSITNLLEQNKSILLILDVNGFDLLLEKFPHSNGIFILPPSIEALKERLISRNTETEDEINIRLKTAKKEIQVCIDDMTENNEKRYIKYNMKIVNNHLNDTISTLIDFIKFKESIKNI